MTQSMITHDALAAIGIGHVKANICSIFFVKKTGYSYEKTFNSSNTFILN
jgi:hypothetical protein